MMPCQTEPWSEAEIVIYEIGQFLGIMENVRPGLKIRCGSGGLHRIATLMTRRLCDYMRKLTSAERRKLYADMTAWEATNDMAYKGSAVSLKSWWRKHKKWDATRVDREAVKRLRRSAAEKLTPEERKALGL